MSSTGCSATQPGSSGGGFFAGSCAGGAGLGWEVVGGDLQAVEEDAGELAVDGAAGDAVHDFEQAALHGWAVFERVEVQDGELDGVADGDGFGVAAGLRAVRGVVRVAEVLAAQGWGAAAAAVGADVTALKGLGGIWHMAS